MFSVGYAWKVNFSNPRGARALETGWFIIGVEGDEPGLEVEGWLQGLTADASSSWHCMAIKDL